jgi:hypothetical protein
VALQILNDLVAKSVHGASLKTIKAATADGHR